MDCEQTREEFSALLDGELDAQVRAAVEAHLAGCAACLRELDRLKRVDQAYRALPPQAAPDVLAERVRETLAPRTLRFRRSSPLPRRLAPLLAAAALLAVVVGMQVALFPRRSPDGFRMARSEAPPAPEAALDSSEAQSGRAAPSERPAGDQGVQHVADAAGTRARGLAPTADPPAALGLPAEAETDDEALRRRASSPASSAVRDQLEALGYVAGAAVARRPEAEAPSAKGHPLAFEQQDRLKAPAQPEPSAVPPSRGAVLFSEPEAPAMALRVDERAKAGAQGGFGGGGYGGGGRIRGGTAAAKTTEQVVGGRTFTLVGSEWRQRDYGDQETTRLHRDSEELRALAEECPDIEAFLALGERVVFEWKGTWYRVEPPVKPKG